MDPSHVAVIACGALGTEIRAMIELNKLKIRLFCLSATLHNMPGKIPETLRKKIHQLRLEGYSRIFIAYGDCGTGGRLEALCAEEGVTCLTGPHCYSFFYGNKKFASASNMTAFYLTDFLARQFDCLIWKAYRLENSFLRQEMFGNYTELVYLAQTQDSELDRLAQRAAQKLGLAYRKVFTGYGDLETFLSSIG